MKPQVIRDENKKSLSCHHLGLIYGLANRVEKTNCLLVSTQLPIVAWTQHMPLFFIPP